MSELRKSGIDVLGEIPWGSHFCNFYKAKQDLLDILIPYFKAGLENNEFCLCVISEPSDQLTVKEATSALRNALPDIDRYLAEGRIEIVSYEEWFLNKGVYDLNGVINRFIEKLNIILAKGFNGMRVNGGSGWLLGKEKELHKFEKELGKLIANQHMIVLCNFPLHGIRGDDVFDIAQTHQFAIARRKGKWEVIETAMQIQARAEIKKLNEELELRVVERTKELAATNIELRREIAERKHAETLLYTKEQEFRAIVENSPDQIIRYDREFRRTYVNPAVVRAYGLSVEALTDKPIGSVIQDAGLNDKENDLARVRQRIAAVFDTGKSYEYEIAWSIPEGLKYYSIRLFPELDLKGSVINVLGIARDITERKDAEEELRRSEDNLRLVIDKIPVMVFTSLPDGSIDFVNQQWLQYMGLSLEDVKDWAWESTIHPEDRQKSIDHWRSTMATGQPSENELRVRRADGVYRWILGRFVPLHDESGKIIKWYGVSIDIEDSKQAQDALRESEQQYLSLFENMAEGVAYFQMLFKDGKLQDAIYLEVNPAWINLTGLKNVIGRKITEVFPGILEANSEFFERSVRVALTGQSERFEIYSTLLKKWLSVSAYCPKKDHVIVVFDDISKRKLAEETLQQSYEAIRQLTEHLQKIREEERTSIAREIHDELGQQLTAVKMDVAWIDKKIPEETRDIKRKLKNIIELLDGSNQSIRRILSELRPRILDDHGLLEAIEWLGRQFTETTGIPVKCTTPEKDIKVSEQIATCLFRVCQEAFTNITRYAFAKNVSVSIRVIEENIILTIEDNGIGFDTTLIENKKSFGILGMKERVFSLGGKFELLSSPGKGAKITVSLPYKL